MVSAKPKDVASTQRKRTAKKLAKIVTAPKPRVKVGGRVAGTPNKATVTKEEMLQAALADSFQGMTDDDLKALCRRPLEVLEMLLHGALKARSFMLAKGLAIDILPYREAKLVAPPPPNDPDAPPIVFKILGGLPQRVEP